jgi:hypothetical protein
VVDWKNKKTFIVTAKNCDALLGVDALKKKQSK